MPSRLIANCTPTRAALMNGQYGARTGAYTVGSIDRFKLQGRPLRPADNVTSLPADLVILRQALNAAGYTTGMFGKWYIGQRGDYPPAKRGYDEAIVNMGSHFDFRTTSATEYLRGT